MHRQQGAWWYVNVFNDVVEGERSGQRWEHLLHLPFDCNSAAKTDGRGPGRGSFERRHEGGLVVGGEEASKIGLFQEGQIVETGQVEAERGTEKGN
ncbi:unnamed protein product [Protopolystoma xenopodis]|uniref:Uncharacterized protein n=1 Tax=Protopolystoma xenopodis TaxID=117903 RepID=A0A448X5N3_9PLAT|nr:unnamed protein product [Protopolystoma xenopodis]